VERPKKTQQTIEIMKNSYKLALLAVLGLAGVSAVQAQSDLIVGVYQPGDANTTAVDLGAFSSLTAGETFNLSSALTAAGITSLTSSGVFGVVGDVHGSSAATRIVYVTDTGTPNTFTGASAFNNINTSVQSIALGTQAVGSGFDWASETDPTAPNTAAAALGYNISGSVANPINFYAVADNNSAPVLDGNFTLNTSTDVLTFNSVAVPEPTSYGLIAGAGLLIVSLRNKFSRKQA
jgi:hypothetical protein